MRLKDYGRRSGEVRRTAPNSGKRKSPINLTQERRWRPSVGRDIEKWKLEFPFTLETTPDVISFLLVILDDGRRPDLRRFGILSEFFLGPAMT